MPVLGLGSKKTNKKSTKKDSKNNSNADEAKELLKQMEAKKEQDICPFC